MIKRNSFRCIFLFLLAFSLIVFSFKEKVYSKTDATGIPLDKNPRGIAINHITDIAVISNEKSDSVSVVDLNSHSVLATIAVGRSPYGVAIDKDLNAFLVTNSKDDTVSVIDLNTLSAIRTIPVGKEPEGVTINPLTHTALTANHKDDTVSVIDLISNKTIYTIPVGKEPKDIAIDPELNLALVTNEKDNNVSVIDLNTYQAKGIVPVGKRPIAIDINPETHTAAVVNEKDNSITVIDLTSWRVFTIPTGKHPIDIAINQLDNRGLVICDEEKSLLLIDLATGAIIKDYPINKLSKGVAVNNLANIAAVTDDKTDSLTLIQLPNPIPQITTITPFITIRGSNSESIKIEGSKFIKTSKAYFESEPLETTFIDNHSLSINIPGNFLLKTGTYSITVKNPEPEGGTSNQFYLKVENPVPQISAIDPLETKTNVKNLILTIFGTGFFDDTELYFNNQKKPITYISPTKLQLNLTYEDLKTAGEYEITARNLSLGGGTSNKAIFTIKPSLEIAITSPANRETINKAKTIVKGTFKSETRDIGITLNGKIAEIRGNEWIANDIPLKTGINTITATIKDSEGNTESASTTINTEDTTQPVTLSANITSGIPPLTTYFSVSTEMPNPITTYQIDFEGDGTIDYTGPTFENISYAYTSEGVFYPTITVTDDQGNSYSDIIAITVLNKTEIDTLLKGKWEGMKEELKKGNIERVLTSFLNSSQERYRYIFTNLADSLMDIAANLQSIEMISMKNNISEYRIKRLEDVGEVTYYIYFVVDENGVWKILQF